MPSDDVARKAADDQLTEAVRGVLDAYDYADPTRVLTDFVLIAATQGYDTDGQGEQAYHWFLRDGDLPWHRIFGLLEVGRLKLLAAYNEPEETT